MENIYTSVYKNGKINESHEFAKLEEKLVKSSAFILLDEKDEKLKKVNFDEERKLNSEIIEILKKSNIENVNKFLVARKKYFDQQEKTPESEAQLKSTEKAQYYMYMLDRRL